VSLNQNGPPHADHSALMAALKKWDAAAAQAAGAFREWAGGYAPIYGAISLSSS
jgi:hypothetical protein